MTIGRRNLLGAALGAGGSAVSWPLSANAAPLTYDEAIKAARAPLRATPVHNELVRYATLAANSHNTQPWTFVAGATRMTIAPDFVRRCPAVDPDDHHLFASLGCAAENLVQAAAALGLKTSVVLEGDAIALDLEAASPVRSAQFEAITARQSTRAVYDGKPVASEGACTPCDFMNTLISSRR